MTTQDLKQIENLLERKLEQKLEAKFDVKLKNIATKDDLKDQDKRFDAKLEQQTVRFEAIIGESVEVILESVDTSMTYKKDFGKLEKKVERIHKALQSV